MGNKAYCIIMFYFVAKDTLGADCVPTSKLLHMLYVGMETTLGLLTVVPGMFSTLMITVLLM